MSIPAHEADRILNALAARVEVWRPGAYAGSLYADLARAGALVAAVSAADRAFYAERLGNIAARVGVLLAPSATPSPIATVKTKASLREIVAALQAVEPAIEVREESPGAFTLWCDRVQAPTGNAPPAWLIAEIDAALRLFVHRGVWSNYVLLPAG